MKPLRENLLVLIPTFMFLRYLISPTNLLVRDTVTISIVITGISLAIPVSVLLARVGHVDTVILNKVFFTFKIKKENEKAQT